MRLDNFHKCFSLSWFLTLCHHPPCRTKGKTAGLIVFCARCASCALYVSICNICARLYFFPQCTIYAQDCTFFPMRLYFFPQCPIYAQDCTIPQCAIYILSPMRKICARLYLFPNAQILCKIVLISPMHNICATFAQDCTSLPNVQ